MHHKALNPLCIAGASRSALTSGRPLVSPTPGVSDLPPDHCSVKSMTAELMQSFGSRRAGPPIRSPQPGFTPARNPRHRLIIRHAQVARYNLSPLLWLTMLTLWVTPGFAINPVQKENAKAGTRAWQLINPALNHEIEGYASLTSVNRGSAISLFVNTVDPNYLIEVYRMGWYGGLGARLVAGAVTRPGIAQPIPVEDAGNGYLIECNWADPYNLPIPDNPDPTDWCSGVYLAKLTGTVSGKQSYIMFVVRDGNRASDCLFQSSVTTFQAYNEWGGRSLYGWEGGSGSCAISGGKKVSFNRPYFVCAQFSSFGPRRRRG